MLKLRSVPTVSNLLMRLAVGLPMICIGISHYREFDAFFVNATDGLEQLWILGAVWSYILPGLLIVGGGLLISARYGWLAAWMGGLALGSVPVGLLLKTVMSGLPLPAMLDASLPAMLWLIAFYLALNKQLDLEELTAGQT